MSEHFEGRCHCGAIRFSYEGEAIEKGLRCTCSLCRRKGALMTTDVIDIKDLNIEADDDALGLYQFGARTAKHYYCKQCGIYTFHETARFPNKYRVNLGCIESVDVFALDAEVFDGKNLL